MECRIAIIVIFMIILTIQMITYMKILKYFIQGQEKFFIYIEVTCFCEQKEFIIIIRTDLLQKNKDNWKFLRYNRFQKVQTTKLVIILAYNTYMRVMLFLCQKSYLISYDRKNSFTLWKKPLLENY